MGILNDPECDLLSSIAACNDQNKLFVMLDDLSRTTSLVLAGRPEREAEVRLLAGYIVEIRRLLHELASLPPAGGRIALSRERCRSLADRYLELEGMVKELRNDLAGS